MPHLSLYPEYQVSIHAVWVFFNTNEPVTFGVPVMLKEILSVPMVVPSVVGCLVGLLHTFVLPIGNNPVVWLP